jgi:hypothetical protein
MKKITITIMAALMLNGCATQSFQINSAIAPAQPTYEDRQAFFIGGLGQTQTLNVKETCGGDTGKIARVEAEQTFLDGFLGFLSWGIYTPRMARVYCYR